MGRTIVIGDVHGCANEFEELLDDLQIKPEDSLIQVGDLINRGPDSHEVIQIAIKRGVQSILGNHEHRILTAKKNASPGILKDYDLETLCQLYGKDWDYLEKLPTFRYIKSLETVVVHGGFLPDQDWQTQDIETITRIQVIDKNGKSAKRSDAPDAPPWAEFWDGPVFVVYGHTPRPKVLKHKKSIGIDTGCVYGGYLTAYIVEDKAIHQIRAHKAYAHSKRLPDPV